MFALHLKMKKAHWHMSGPHFGDYHLMLDKQADRISATTDAIDGRARKIGGSAMRSIGDVARLQRLRDSDAEFVAPGEMLSKLQKDNARIADFLGATHAVCEDHHDVATASLIENWIDEAERRTWFLFETNRQT